MLTRFALPAFASLLVGCGVPRPPAGVDAPPADSPASVLAGLSLWGARVAGLLFLFCAVGIFFAPSGYRMRVLLAMAAACAMMVGAQTLAFLGAHLALVAGLCLLGALLVGIVFAWIYRKRFVHRAEEIGGYDFDGDGVIGAPHPKIVAKAKP